MRASEIVALGPQDKDWVLRVWKPSTKILGPGGLAWLRWQQGGNTNEYFIGIREVAFAHYRKRRDGVNVLYEIGVDFNAKRSGFGWQLVRHIGFPMELKTDADNEESNAFYQKTGFRLVGQKRGKVKLFNVYRRLY